jgi:hypothetical protein
MRQLKSLIWITSLVATMGLAANQAVNVNGFVSVGFLMPDANQFLGDGDGDNAFLTENGLRMSIPMDNGWAFSGQVIYRDAGDNYDGGLNIDFIQFDYRTQLWAEGQQTTTIGRFKSKQGFYNDTRDVPQTRPSILLPQSVYLDIARNFFLSLDGFKFNSVFPFDNGDLSAEIALGRNRFDDKFSTMALGQTAEGDWDSSNNSYIDLRYESQHWNAAINFAWIDISYKPNSGAYVPVNIGNLMLQAPTAAGNFDSLMSTYSIQYIYEPFEITYEYSNREFDAKGFSPNAPNSKSTMGGQYIQLRYFWLQDLTLLVRYDEFFINKSDKSGDSIAATGNSPDYAFSYDTVLGLVWELKDNWQIAIEHHWVEGGAWLPPLGKGTALPELDSHWEMTAVQVSYQF